VHATATEEFFEKNADLSDEKVLQAALEVLGKEVHPVVEPLEGDSEYRRALTKSLLYKVPIIYNRLVKLNIKGI